MTIEKIRQALVVDDVPSNRKLALVFLSKLGWSAVDVDGGKAALEWLAANPEVDLVLLDISMPDLCGEDVCLRLRAIPRFASLPIVAYTAHALPGDVDRFLANGFNAVLVKPISLQGLRDVISRLVPD
jgi:CheY-like chemotaxis protein